MTQWLRGTTLFQRVALGLVLVAMGAFIASYFSEGTSSSGLVTLALLVCFMAFRKELLWRVRNRLLVTYFLFGVVPVFLIGWSLMLTAELLLGQFATQRVHQDLEARIESVRSAAQNLMLAASHGAKADLLDQIRQRVPKLSAVVRTNGDTLRLPPDGQFQSAPIWIAAGFHDLFESGGRYYIGANVRAGSTEAFAYLPLDKQALASLTPGVVSVAAVLRGGDRTDVDFAHSGRRIAVAENGVRREVVPSGLGPPRGWWDLTVVGTLPWKAQTSSEKVDVVLPLISRPSLLLAGGVTGCMTEIAFSLLVFAGGFSLSWKRSPCYRT